jgi:molecular chaperone Hsp33
LDASPAAELPDQLVRAVSADGALEVGVLVATRLVAEAATRHRTAPTASAALGRALMGAVLLAAGGRDGETVQIQVRGKGSLGTLTAIADPEGRARGFVANPAADPPLCNGKLDVAQAVGEGILAVLRTRSGAREPYRGIVPLVSGEIAEDLAHYLAESEQTPSAVGLGVFVDTGDAVRAAGGYLVKALPEAAQEALARLETNVRALPTPTDMLRTGLRADEILDRLLADLGARARQRIRPRFACGCGRERVLRAVVLLGRAALREVRAQGEDLEVRCEFCGERYRISAGEIGALLPDA